MRSALALASATLLAGCVQPAYYPPQPIQLQPYPPPVPYQTTPDYRPALPPPGVMVYPDSGPLPTPMPSTDGLTAPGDTGPIPLQEMPAPSPDGTAAPSAATAPPAGDPAAATAAPAVERPSRTGPGSNIPLEGFRPMRGQTRPAP